MREVSLSNNGRSKEYIEFQAGTVDVTARAACDVLFNCSKVVAEFQNALLKHDPPLAVYNT